MPSAHNNNNTKDIMIHDDLATLHIVFHLL